jgi:hypothetical protein
MAKSVVCGGATYFSWMLFASFFRRVSMALRRLLDSQGSASLLGVEQALVVLDRNLASIGSQTTAPSSLPGRRMAKSTRSLLPGTRRHVGCKLVGRQQLFEQGRQLDFAPGAARLDIGQHALEVADTGRQRLHFTETAMDLLQAIADQLERFAQTLLQRRMQLLVDRPPHLFQLVGVVGLDGRQPPLDGSVSGVRNARRARAKNGSARGRRLPAARPAACRTGRPASSPPG